MRIVAVPKNHGVDVTVPEAGQQIHAFRGNYLRVLRNCEGAHGADLGNAFAFDKKNAVGEGRSAESIDQSPTDECERARLCK